jgi:hypothetical protein
MNIIEVTDEELNLIQQALIAYAEQPTASADSSAPELNIPATRATLLCRSLTKRPKRLEKDLVRRIEELLTAWARHFVSQDRINYDFVRDTAEEIVFLLTDRLH